MLVLVMTIGNCAQASGEVTTSTDKQVREVLKRELSSIIAIADENMNGAVELEFVIDWEGEIAVLNAYSNNDELKNWTLKELKQIVFPGLDEAKGKIYTYKFSLKN